MINISHSKQQLLDNVVSDLKKIQNIAAIVLGGSHASGQAHDASDLDIGLYYYKDNPFSLKDVAEVAEKYSTAEPPTVTGFYEWGPWVNGGAWITNSISDVDFVYRNIEQVQGTIQKAKDGIWENNFEQQPPYGFVSMIYLAETQHCVALHDPSSVIEKLKREVSGYPSKLKKSIVQQSLWAAEFTIMHAEGFSKKQDVYNTAGCLTRAMKNLINVLFALNELYPMTDKRALEILESSPVHPSDLKNRVTLILSINASSLSHNVDLLKGLFQETLSLAPGFYKPYYKL